ncbi:hornerin-like [Pararge aegeria]|uniref:hornerin-like n=1 Tax=Pararge aegeria TaxID=116150 RepID=UPI0019D21C2A|nr:hornerin-like [Pararge aegeria]
MCWAGVLVLGVCVLTAHSAVLRTKDATFSRIARSPHYGSSYHHDDFDLSPPPHGPPSPPIVYHTQNWSGVAKGIGGTPQGVFSGAAASAQSGAPTDSEAFSIAASGTVPVPSDDEGQVKENVGKSDIGSHSKYGSSEGHHSAGSLGNKYGGYSSSGEGQYNIKSSGLEFGGGVTGSGSEGSEKSGQYSAGSSGFNTNLAGGISAGHGNPTGQSNVGAYSRQSEQRSFNSGLDRPSFGSGRPTYGRQNGQYGSSKGFDVIESGSKFGSGSLTGGYSAGSAATDYSSQLQTSNKGRLAGFNGQSGQYDTATSGFGSKSESAGSAHQFGPLTGQSSGSGYQPGGYAGFDRHGENNEARREFVSHGGYGSPHSDHHDEINRHGKSHQGFQHFDHSGDGKFGNRGDASQGFSENGQVRGFSNSQSSSFGSNRGNFGSGLGGSEVGYSGSQGQVESSKLGAGLIASQGGAQDFSGTQHLKKLGQLETSLGTSQAGHSGLSGIQSQSRSDASGLGYNKDSGSSNTGNNGALDAGNGNSGTSSAEGSFSGGTGAPVQEDIQSTLGSALNLASQGLQTAQRTPCRTCDKGSYAFSNAKSHSGSAIALSIGG